MKLRNLELKDAALMLEWMHDRNVTEYMQNNFEEKTIDDAVKFIEDSMHDQNNIHLAITDEEDNYRGTVSLKNIENGSAEFAITVSSSAMGKGFAWYGMQTIISKAFNEFGLNSVYWCVNRDNTRAVRFYDKHNFHEMKDIPETVLERYQGNNNLKWYSVLKGDDLSRKETVVGCLVKRLKTISTIDSGELSFFEGDKDIPFEIKRIYFITKVPDETVRGFHAHRELKQLLFCPYGAINLELENELGREHIILSDPSIGVVIDRPTWREMTWLKENSVLCVAASEYYDANDYIRDYSEFRNLID